MSTAVLMSDNPDGKSLSPNIASACSGVKLSAQSPIGLDVRDTPVCITAPLFSIVYSAIPSNGLSIPGKLTFIVDWNVEASFIANESTVAPESSRDCCATDPYSVFIIFSALISCPINFSTSNDFSISIHCFTLSNVSGSKSNPLSTSIDSGPSSCIVSRFIPACFKSAALKLP